MERDLTRRRILGPFTTPTPKTTGCSLNYYDLSMYNRLTNPPESESGINFEKILLEISNISNFLFFFHGSTCAWEFSVDTI